MQEAIKIHPADTVAVALNTLGQGQTISLADDEIKLMQEIPAGHKFALQEIPPDTEIIKYGHPIGKSVQAISTGEWVHTHNLKTGLCDLMQYSYQPGTHNDNPSLTEEMLTFMGYRRENGKVGIRNEIWIIPTVGCVNDVARALERESREYLEGTVEDIVAFTHPYGCSQLGEDQLNTQKILADLINHPNAVGVLVLGLGCENNNVDEMKKQIGEYNEDRVKFLICQECEDEMEEGLQLLRELIRYGASFRREELPVGELIIGLKCGGSDGLSGITANPLVGAFSDQLIAQGGTTILTEVPEMFGAETILMNRCANETLFHKTVALINDFKQYYLDYHQPIYENPSPGNKKGGISTLEDKSLGCTQKSGQAPIMGVLSYGEQVKDKGLMLLSSPGNDLIAATALAASGAHIILFTTGRGTPFGAPVPTIKISSNTQLALKKQGWIDYDAGKLLRGHDMRELSEELLLLVRDTASGAKVKCELHGYRDIAIFKQGVTL